MKLFYSKENKWGAIRVWIYMYLFIIRKPHVNALAWSPVSLTRNAFSIYLHYFTNDLSKEFLVFAGMWEINGISEQDAFSKSTVAIYVYESDFYLFHQTDVGYRLGWGVPFIIKVALSVCFALKSWKEYLLLFTYVIILGKVVTFPLITKFKTNRYLSYLSVNRIPN